MVFDIKDSISNYVSGSNELLDCDTNVNICSSTVDATDAHSIVSNLSNFSINLHKHQKNEMNPHENNNTNIINTTRGNNYTNTYATNWNRHSNNNGNSTDKSGEESQKKKDNIPNDGHVLTIDEQPSNIINVCEDNLENAIVDKYPYVAIVKSFILFLFMFVIPLHQMTVFVVLFWKIH